MGITIDGRNLDAQTKAIIQLSKKQHIQSLKSMRRLALVHSYSMVLLSLALSIIMLTLSDLSIYCTMLLSNSILIVSVTTEVFKDLRKLNDELVIAILQY